MKIIQTLARLAVAATLFAIQPSVHAQSAEEGKAAYIANGCWQCHGFVGQGGIAGAKLAPDPKPLEYIAAFVRNTNGLMPKYSDKILSDKDLAGIHAYLRSIPKSPDYKSIPQLN